MIYFSDVYPAVPDVVAPAIIQWRFDFAGYVEATDEQKKRMILEAVHAACLWAADVHGWETTAPFDEARDRLLTDNFQYLFVSRKGLHVEGLPTKVRIGVQMDLEQLEVYAIARRRWNEPDRRVPFYTTWNMTEDYENKYFDRFHSPGRGLLSFSSRDGDKTVDLIAAMADDRPE